MAWHGIAGRGMATSGGEKANFADDVGGRRKVMCDDVSVIVGVASPLASDAYFKRQLTPARYYRWPRRPCNATWLLG
ncbi:hypothetical protein VP1G_11506 [Cytospora mali]|nr:hypothetical protein VP1G_11506 [Valsa mali var. pyri (nom. inval.)]